MGTEITSTEPDARVPTARVNRRELLRRGGAGVAGAALLHSPWAGAAQTPDATPVAPANDAPLVNLAHLDVLGHRVTPPRQEGHTTYRIDQEPELHALWTYAAPTDDGTYDRLGGGEYDATTDTWSQGAFNTDDLARAAVVYIRHWRSTESASSRDAAYGLLRTVAYMQTTSAGPRRGNVVLWMQPDGTLTPSAEPVELPDPSDSGPSFWLARTIWALGEGYAAFIETEPEFAAFLGERMDLALDALDRQVLTRYGETMRVDGMDVPAWLIIDGADATAEAVFGLAAYVRAGGGSRARRVLTQLAEGVAQMRPGAAPSEWPFGAILPWALSRSVWHGWGDQMAGALAEAGAVLDVPMLVEAAVGAVGTFTPHLLVQGGADQGWQPAPVEIVQIAYGADATLQNLLRCADATGQDAFRHLAGIAGAWYFGNNRSGSPMYDPATGITFDGLEADGNVNRNAGAESTIHGLLSMLELDAHPSVRAMALRAQRVEQVTWQLVEAESGNLEGDGEVVQPESAWTGESAWSGGAYVELREGSSVTVEVSLPTEGRYRLLPVFERQEGDARSVGTIHEAGGVPGGTSWQGGAGDAGISTTSGYLDIGNLEIDGVLAGGPTSVESAYAGEGDPARLDALLVQPEVEYLLLEGRDGIQGLLRSWANDRRSQRVRFDASDAVEAFVYDAAGRLVQTVGGTGGSLDVPVEPGGFSYVTGSRG